jgi:hypothetical protein
MTPARPIVSLARPQFFPLIETLPETVRSMSVLSQGSTQRPTTQMRPVTEAHRIGMSTPSDHAYRLFVSAAKRAAVAWLYKPSELLFRGFARA